MPTTPYDSARVPDLPAQSTYDYFVIDLTAEERDLLLRPITAERWGGFQTCVHKLQRGIAGLRLGLSREEAVRVIRYATSHGGGGYQDRIKGLVARLEARLAEFPDGGLGLA